MSAIGHTKQAALKRSVNSALVALGVPRSQVYKSCNVRRPSSRIHVSIWESPEPVLWSLLELARESWRKLAVKLHPERGGDAAKFSAASDAWRFVRCAFERRGYVLE